MRPLIAIAASLGTLAVCTVTEPLASRASAQALPTSLPGIGTAGNPAPTYIVHGDGTVTDPVTGLMWEQGFRQLDFAEAEAAADAATTGGHTDWRVPSVDELYSLMLFSGDQGHAPADRATPPDTARPFLDTTAFAFEYPTGGRYIDAQYLTSTVYTATVMGAQHCFFGVNFADGRIKCYPLRTNPNRGSYYARFVRANPAYGLPDYHDNGDGTVSDLATGLTWAQADSGDALFAALVPRADGTMDWEEAQDFAEALVFAGHDDWRLPDAHELQGLVDYARAPDSTGSAAIDPVFAVTPITNEAGLADFPAYWSATLFNPGQDAVLVYFGRAMGYFAPPGHEIGFYDVHGAGAQRTEPRTGSPDYGHGPQGDVRRIYNFVRVVRGG